MTRAGRRPRLALPEREPDSHKGQNGLVLVAGGSKDYVGAPALAGLAALRAGCDIVRIAAPEKAAWAMNALSPDLITVKLKGDYISEPHIRTMLDLSKRSDAVLIGPGMSDVSARIVNLLLKGVANLGVPMVVDADAVKVAEVRNLKDAIITPHANEFDMFLRANKRTALASGLKDSKLSDGERVCMIQEELSDFFSAGNVLLLKGHRDLVISKDRSMISKGGNAGMTVGGTGDILAGLCAGYLAQTADLFTSAGLASHNCKRIGDLLLKRSNFGFGFIASDFLREIKKLGVAGRKVG
ncbi:MAG: NAD(P)H-hydrate dehydratase [Nanoarchaeota archaeon]|nr:NAD(P)H-hydrate dehydratase [Nanoarchaeota archaeon]